MSEGTRLILLRHGESTHNAAGIYQGQLDTDLSERGVDQAAVAAISLASMSPARIVSSDLRRAAHTAAALGERVSQKVEYDSRLREIDVGAWSGMSHRDVLQEYPDETRSIADGVDVRRGGHGESVRDVMLRTHEVALEVAESMSSGEISVLVTHGVAARALLCALLGWSYEQAWLGVAGLRNCHWGELAHHRTGWRLVSWNAGASVLDGFQSVPDGAPRP